MAGPAGEVSSAPKEQLDRSKDLANQFADSANRLLHVRDASREATFRQFTFIQYGAVTFALTFDGPMWLSMLGAAFFGLLGAGTMAAIQYSIELLQDYLRYLETFQRGEKEEMPQSWLGRRDAIANAGRFVGFAPTLRSVPMLVCSIGALGWCLLSPPIQPMHLGWAAAWIGLVGIALFLGCQAWFSYKKDRRNWEWNRDHNERGPVPMQPNPNTRTRSARGSRRDRPRPGPDLGS